MNQQRKVRSACACGHTFTIRRNKRKEGKKVVIRLAGGGNCFPSFLAVNELVKREGVVSSRYNGIPEAIMSPDRVGRLRLIGVTSFITCVATLIIAYAFMTFMSRRSPPTPHLLPPKTITVTLYPMREFVSKASPPIEIPASEFEFVMRLVTPDKYMEGGTHDWIMPLLAEVVITHDSQPETHLLVRWSGKNPALISVDGRNYFYGTTDRSIHDGGMQLLALVQRFAEAKGR